MPTGRTPVVLLQLANLLGGVANSSVSVLLPWLVLERTGSPASAGLVAAVAAVPGIVVAPLVGALTDKLGRRTVSMASDAFSAGSVALFPLVDRGGGLTLGVIVALAVLGAVFDPAGYTARKSLIPDVARAGGIPVDRINGIHEGIFAAGWVIGPALAAFGIGTIGVIASFWVTAAAFLLAVAAVAGIRVTEAIDASRHEHGEEHEPFWTSSLRGVRVLWADKPMRVLTLAVVLLALIYLPTEAILIPVHFETLDQPGAYGLTLTMLAAGAMLGSFSYGWLAVRFTRHQIVMGVMGSVTLAILPMAFLPPVPVFVTAGFLLGLGWGPIDPLLNTIVQQRVPAHVQGRVYGAQMALFYAAPALGLLLGGVAVEAFGVPAVYAGIGVLLAGTALATTRMPSLRGLDDPAG